MDRKHFLKLLTLLPLSGAAMKLNELNKFAMELESTERMPVLFVGHGSPMNALLENEYSLGWKSIASSIPKPKAILCISAHWETNGTFVTAMEQPKTIHDFGGFPNELFEFLYPAPGSLEIAIEAQKSIQTVNVGLDHTWGLDHGCWSIMTHLYPKADVPVLQLSLDYNKSPLWHYNLAKELSSLRKKGILIIGSGNIVHNLRMLSWNSEKPYDWALEANEKIKGLISSEEHTKLINYTELGKEVLLAIPSPEHYLPLLYILGMKNKNERVSFFNDKAEMGSISMTSLKISN